jgi:uncharacterized RDD family membrane protein YckC
MICNNCKIENTENLDTCRCCGAKFAEISDEEIVQPVESSAVLYAGFWKRAAAALIDSFLLFLFGTVLGFIFIIATGSDQGFEIVSNILGILFGWFYFALMESSERQATIGKYMLGIMVTDTHGRRISFYRASGRHFGKIVSSITLGIGFIMAGFTKKKQTLHDIMFDCLVVVKN